jgi:acetyl-CoA synthetase
VNCLDRHLPERADQVAIYWEGEPGDRRTIRYGELHHEVCALAAGLRGLGVQPGDRVALYMGLIPEAVTVMLACSRIGAVHALITGALPPEAVVDRLDSLRPRVLVTQDGAWRHGAVLPLKARVDEAESACSGIERTIVVRRTDRDVDWYEGDVWYEELLASPAPSGGWEQPPAFPADHPLLLVFVADPGGRQKAIIHGTGGFLVYATTFQHRALTVEPTDTMWAVLDFGWLAGQAHGVYGPLACGAATVLFEGMLDTPTPARTWEIVERYGVTVVATTPSMARRLRRWTTDGPSTLGGESVRLIATAGEPIEREMQDWLRTALGRGAVQVCDGWGQTELGGIVTFSPWPEGPGSMPSPGFDVVDDDGITLPAGALGELVLRNPWPGMFLDADGEERDVDRYWSYPGAYATGDLARLEPDGTPTMLGRKDELVKVMGQFVSLPEVSISLRSHPLVRDVEVVQLKTEDDVAILAVVVLDPDAFPGEWTRRELMDHVADTIGGLARPRAVIFAESFAGLSRQARRALVVRLDPAAGYGSEVVSLAALAALTAPDEAGSE